MKVEVFCSCGGGLRGRVKSRDPKAIEKLVAMFRLVHDLPECGPADAKAASKARREKSRTQS
jgi:hypothetical protein